MLVIVILGTCWRLLFSLFSLLAPAYRMSAPSEYELGKGRDSRVLLAGLALAVGSSGLGDVDPIGEKEARQEDQSRLFDQVINEKNEKFN